jgi:predicted esterase
MRRLVSLSGFLIVPIFATLTLSGCALQWAHTRRNLHFARYRLAAPKMSAECGTEGDMSFCRYKPENAPEDPETTIYFLHYATGDEHSLYRLGLAGVLYRTYQKAGLPAPRIISVSYGSHWLFSNRPGRRQVQSTDRFIHEALPWLEKRFGSSPKKLLWGMSQGGYNALEVLLTRPDDWLAAAVSCPALYAVDPFSGKAAAVAQRMKAPESWVKDGMALFNTRLADSQAWTAEEPIGRARSASALPPLLIQANRGDEFGFFEGADTLAEAWARHGLINLEKESGSHCVNDVAKVAEFFAKQTHP